MNYLFAHSPNYMGLKENLKALMEKHGENPHSLSAKSKVTQPTIFRILSGDSKDPRRSNVEKLARFFHVTPEEMYGTLNNQTAAKQNAAIYAVNPAPPAAAQLTDIERDLIAGFHAAPLDTQAFWINQARYYIESKRDFSPRSEKQ